MPTLKQNSFKRKNIVTKSVYWAALVKGNSVSRDKQLYVKLTQTKTLFCMTINIEFIKKNLTRFSVYIWTK